MKIFYYILLVIACTACATHSIIGTYVNQCKLYNSPEAIVTLNYDSTFTCVFPYIKGEYIEGVWKINSDTVTLESRYFVREKEKQSVQPENKYAQFPNLLIKGKKLYEITSDKSRESCYYVKKKK